MRSVGRLAVGAGVLCALLLAAGLPVPAAMGTQPEVGAESAPPPEFSPNEPPAREYSSLQAARYLDRAAIHWQKTQACVACHTMLPYMIARPALKRVLPIPPDVPAFYEEIVSGKRAAMPNYTCGDVDGAVAIGVAAAMALHDRGGPGTLQPATRTALGRMWAQQRPDGGWNWVFRDVPPFKTRDHIGVTLAAIAAGAAPGEHRGSPEARAGLAALRHYLDSTPPVGLHERAMLLWANALVPELLTESDRASYLAALLQAQRPDGGWSMASLADNTADPVLPSERVGKARSAAGYGSVFLVYAGRGGEFRSLLTSDGYATGLCVYVARQAGVPAGDPRLRRGIAWLKANQRESGRWFTPSQGPHQQHRISNLGTGFAVLALASCGALSSGARSAE
jgi:squalene-hopene/tetraprenyl-beta-curcumene cyclase